MQHGTTSMYNAGKCRCDECKAARLEYDRSRRLHAKENLDDLKHGTTTAYGLGCRCPLCRDAGTQNRKARGETLRGTDKVPHGTITGYSIAGCRCDECRAWRKVHGRKSWIKKTYGLTTEDFESMWVSQDGLCDSCSDPLVYGPNCHIDHDHTTGAVRGLLCRGCNHALGNLKEEPRRMLALVDYIKRHQQGVM